MNRKLAAVGLLIGFGVALALAAVTKVDSLSIAGTNTVREVVVTNGVTLGGVRLTAWPSGTLPAVVEATKAFRFYQGSLTHAGTVTLDFDATTTVNSLPLTGNVTFATSNLATNRTYRLRIIGTSTNATPTWPAWNFQGGAPPIITASKIGRLSLEAWGTADTDVDAWYTESQ